MKKDGNVSSAIAVSRIATVTNGFTLINSWNVRHSPMAATGREIKTRGPRHLSRSPKTATTTYNDKYSRQVISRLRTTRNNSCWDVMRDYKRYLNWMEQREEAWNQPVWSWASDPVYPRPATIVKVKQMETPVDIWYVQKKRIGV